MGLIALDAFVGEGALVAGIDLNIDPIRAAATHLGSDRVLAIEADVTNADDARAAVERTIAQFRGLDVLYNSAGVCDVRDQSVVTLQESIWDRTMAINVKGTALCCKYAIPKMIERGGGSIINVSSIVAFVGCSEAQDAYAASKGAVVALTKSLAVQFGPLRIRTNAIAPGPIETPMLREQLDRDPRGTERRLGRIPLNSLGRPEDVVLLAVHLASDESRWTNGAVILVDGGITSHYY